MKQMTLAVANPCKYALDSDTLKTRRNILLISLCIIAIAYLNPTISRFTIVGVEINFESTAKLYFFVFCVLLFELLTFLTRVSYCTLKNSTNFQFNDGASNHFLTTKDLPQGISRLEIWAHLFFEITVPYMVGFTAEVILYQKFKPHLKDVLSIFQ